MQLTIKGEEAFSLEEKIIKSLNFGTTKRDKYCPIIEYLHPKKGVVRMLIKSYRIVYGTHPTESKPDWNRLIVQYEVEESV